MLLLNADKLTIDAQSALRRCIELYSCSTRFFIVVEDKYKLLKPILSRFCDIYISLPLINGNLTNLNLYNLQKNNKFIDNNKNTFLKKKIVELIKNDSNLVILKFSLNL